MSMWEELKRRNVVRVGLAYALVCWVVLQALDFTLQVIDAPNWVLQTLVAIALIGLPAVLVFAWVFEMTPEGIKRESEIDRSQSITAHTGKKLNFAIMGTLALAVALLAYRQFMAPAIPGEALADRAGAPASLQEASAQALPRSIAVLPFEDYSEGGDQGYFSKGIAEEVLNLLAKTDSLRVAARTSSFAFADTNEDIRKIGQKLEVGTVLEGSIRKAGTQVRITAQLINVEDGYHIWSETYDREFEDIFKIQDEIAASIMASLRVHLLDEEQQRMQSLVAQNIDAYSAYLIGRERLALRTPEDIAAARAKFEEALELDPDYAPAMVQLAHAWLLSERFEYGGEDLDRESVDAIVTPLMERALALAPDDPEAVSVQGFHDLNRYRYPQARQAFDRALQLNPNDAQTYAWRAEIAFQEKRYLDMLADKEKAYALDPMSLQISADLAGEYRNFWRPEDAQRIIDRMFDLHPDHPLAYQASIFNLSNHGRYGEAMLMLQKAMLANPGNELFERYEGWAYLSLGMLDEAAEHGDDQVKFAVAIVSENFEAADRLLLQGLAGEDPDDWYLAGRWLYSVDQGEGARSQLTRYLDLDLSRMDQEGFPWQTRCLPYLISDLRAVGEGERAEPVVDSCREGIEERYKARYLCPCSLETVVMFTIIDGRVEEALERTDFWLSNGGSDFSLHNDPIFNELADQPGYDTFLARNTAQMQRQQEIFLAGADRVHAVAHP